MKTTLKGCVVEKCIRISALFSAFERIFDKDYYFGGETHDFWELVCVVEGAIRVTAGEDIFMLEEGQAVLHSPMEFHSFWSEKGTMPHQPFTYIQKLPVQYHRRTAYPSEGAAAQGV